MIHLMIRAAAAAAAAQYARLLRVFSLLDAFVPPRPEEAATPAGLVLTAAQVRVLIEL
jgi:hypothetical protein